MVLGFQGLGLWPFFAGFESSGFWAPEALFILPFLLQFFKTALL